MLMTAFETFYDGKGPFFLEGMTIYMVARMQKSYNSATTIVGGIVTPVNRIIIYLIKLNYWFSL